MIKVILTTQITEFAQTVGTALWNVIIPLSAQTEHMENEPTGSLTQFGKSQDLLCLIPRHFESQGDYTATIVFSV